MAIWKGGVTLARQGATREALRGLSRQHSTAALRTSGRRLSPQHQKWEGDSHARWNFRAIGWELSSGVTHMEQISLLGSRVSSNCRRSWGHCRSVKGEGGLGLDGSLGVNWASANFLILGTSLSSRAFCPSGWASLKSTAALGLCKSPGLMEASPHLYLFCKPVLTTPHHPVLGTASPAKHIFSVSHFLGESVGGVGAGHER